MKTSEKTIKAYEKALRWMPARFTSHFFTKRLRNLGVSEAEIQNDYYYEFLLSECVKVKRMHCEKKNKRAKSQELVDESPIEATIEAPIEESILKPKRKYTWQKREQASTPVMLTEEEMIELLKAKGYKVLKQIWNEL